VSDSLSEYVPRAGEFDPLADEPSCSSILPPDRATSPAMGTGQHKPHRPLVQFYKPSELIAYEPPPDHSLIGDMHLQRGALAILGGPPGVGKSRAVLSLAIAGAKGGGEWFGFKVHTQFRTLWLQSENGLVRLHRDLQRVKEVAGLEDWMLISAPPVCGLALHDARFRREVVSIIKSFAPHLIALDPWNQATRDTQERDYQEALSRLREIVAESTENAASLVVHHLRKPKSEDRHKGRSLAYLLSGSNALYGAARSVFIMQPASDELENRQIVFTPSKCNDSETVVDRAAWHLKDGVFVHVENFDFEAFDSNGVKREPKVREEHVRQLLAGGRRMVLKQAAAELQTMVHVGRSVAYDALKVSGGRFSHLLVRDPDTGLIGLCHVEGTQADAEN
jgi:hypothetical protein